MHICGKRLDIYGLELSLEYVLVPSSIDRAGLHFWTSVSLVISCEGRFGKYTKAQKQLYVLLMRKADAFCVMFSIRALQKWPIVPSEEQF